MVVSNSAGVVTNARLDANSDPTEAYDFKGNLLRSTRRLARDYTAIPDWLQPAESQLEAECFEGSTRYDALNRPIQSVAPRSSRFSSCSLPRLRSQPIHFLSDGFHNRLRCSK